MNYIRSFTHSSSPFIHATGGAAFDDSGGLSATKLSGIPQQMLENIFTGLTINCVALYVFYIMYVTLVLSSSLEFPHIIIL